MYYTFKISKNKNDLIECSDIKEFSYLKSTIFIIIGITGLVLGGEWIVNGAVKIAEYFNLSQTLIGLTVVALGTSLPELATSIVATYKNHSDIAIGNIVGSNIFNIFLILGTSSIIKSLPFSHDLNFDVFMVIFTSAILFAFMFIGKKRTIERWQGILMFLLYVVYIVALIITRI